MPISHDPVPEPGDHDHPEPSRVSTPGGEPVQEGWGRPAPEPSPGPVTGGRRFSGVHLAVTGVSALLVGVLATTLTFTFLGSGDDGDDGVDAGSAQAASDSPSGGFDAPVAEEDADSGDDVIGVGDGFTVTTWDGIEVETNIQDYSVDESCKYGMVDPRFAEKAPDSRIVQLTIDVTNHGDDRYGMDTLTALSADGYTQPVETATRYCEEPDDGANRWPGFGHIDKGEKKLLYGAFEVQPDAAQLVLATTGNGRVLMDIPERSSGADADGVAPEPTTSAG
jgi:hypothetical protein